MNTKTRLTPEEETSLIQRASQGDLDAFNDLVLTYQAMAYNHALALLNDRAAAEDVTQEGFIKAFQNIASFRGGSFRGWLLKIVTNTAYDIARKLTRHPSQPLFPEADNGEEVESPFWIQDPGPSVQTEVEQKEFSRDLYRLLDELPDIYRSVLNLVDIDELDYTEAAQALGVPVGTIKSRLARARLQMKEELKNRAGFEGYMATPNVCFAC